MLQIIGGIKVNKSHKQRRQNIRKVDTKDHWMRLVRLRLIMGIWRNSKSYQIFISLFKTEVRVDRDELPQYHPDRLHVNKIL